MVIHPMCAYDLRDLKFIKQSRENYEPCQMLKNFTFYHCWFCRIIRFSHIEHCKSIGNSQNWHGAKEIFTYDKFNTKFIESTNMYYWKIMQYNAPCLKNNLTLCYFCINYLNGNIVFSVLLNMINFRVPLMNARSGNISDVEICKQNVFLNSPINRMLMFWNTYEYFRLIS